MAEIVKLVSGGVDSYIMSQEFDGINVYIDFGQPYAAEEKNALRQLNVPFEEITIKTDWDLWEEGDIYVPDRNLTFASLVSSIFEPDVIMMAGLKDDNCKDKTATEFELIGKILTRYANKQVTVMSPYFGKTKAEVVAEFKGNKKQLCKTFSCYNPSNGRACGSCPACLRKAVALETNGIDAGFSLSKKIVFDYLKKIHTYDKDRISRLFIYLKKHGYKIAAYDLDGTICTEESPLNYRAAKLIGKPIENDKKIIVIYTSRLESDRTITELWLKRNNVPYHSLIMNKLPYSWLIDDKAIG